MKPEWKKETSKLYNFELEKIFRKLTDLLWEKQSKSEWKDFGMKNKDELKSYLIENVETWKQTP